MKNIENPSIQDAARDLISISNELSNLRQAILQHSESAKGLDTASADISRLANILRKIPDSLLNLLQRGDQFIAKVDNSLAPAVVLSETIKNHNDNLNSQQELLAKITQFGEQNKILLSKIYNKSLSLPDSDALDSIGKRIDSLQKSFENHTESMDQVN